MFILASNLRTSSPSTTFPPLPQSTLHNSQRSITPQIRRTSTHKHRKVALLNHIHHTLIPQPQIADLQRNTHIHRFSRLDKHLFEALELDVGDGDASDLIFDVELHHFSAIISAIVGDGDGSSDGVGSRDFRGRQCDIAILERGVGKSVPEGEPWYRCIQDVAASKVQVAISTHKAWIGRSSRVQEVVVGRQSTHIVRETNREFAGGVYRAKEDVSEGVAAFFAGVELLDQGSCGVGDPRFSKWFARRENDDSGFACVDDGFDQSSLCADEAEIAC